MKRKILTAFVSLVLLASLLFVPSVVLANGAPEILMCLILDSSGSIDTGEWNTMIGGLTSALNTALPIDGSVEICVVQFGSSASEELAPIVVDSQTDKDFVINEIQTIIKGGGTTAMHSGINQAVTTMQKSSNFNDPDVWKVINMATDGAPNSASLAETAVTNAVAAGIDELDVEGIGTGAANTWMAEDIVVPDGPGGLPGAIVPPDPYPSRPPSVGFVRVCNTFADYESAIAQKLILILKGQLYLEPKTATNDIQTEHCVIATLNDGYGNPVSEAQIDFVVTGVNSASGSATTIADGTAKFCYTGTNVGPDTITASCADPADPSKILTAEATKDWEDNGTPPPPVEVGGTIYPTNSLVSLTPWIVLAIVITVGTSILMRRRQNQS